MMTMMIVPPMCHLVTVKGALFMLVIMRVLLAGTHSFGGATQVREVKGKRFCVGLCRGGGAN